MADLVNVNVKVGSTTQSIQMERGVTFENKGGIYAIDSDGKLKKFDKKTNVWTNANQIEMTKYQWKAFQNVANNDNDAKTYTKADVENTMELYSQGGFRADMSQDLPSGYRIERPDLSWKEGYVEAYVSNGHDDTSATLKFQLAEVAELKAAAAEKLAKEKRLAQLRSKVSETELKVKVPGADSNDSVLEVSGPAIVTKKGDNKVISFYHNLDSGSEVVSSEFVYDKQGRLVSMYNHSYSEGGDSDDWSTYKYDDNGRLIYEEHRACYDGAYYNEREESEPLGPEPRERYDNKYITEYEYDERGNVITNNYTSYNQNYDVEYSEDGENLVYVKIINDPKSYQSIEHKTYDSQNRVSTVKKESIKYDSQDESSRSITSTNYTYHHDGGRTETYETGKKVVYDAQDRVIKKSSPDGNSSTFKYDKYDNLVETCKYKRDKLVSTLTKERASDGTLLVSTLTDANDKIIRQVDERTNLVMVETLGGYRYEYKDGVCVKSELAEALKEQIYGLSWDKTELSELVNDIDSSNVVSVLNAYSKLSPNETLEDAISNERLFTEKVVYQELNDLLERRVKQARADGVKITGKTPTEIAKQLSRIDAEILGYNAFR